jgi:hypothetical protein
VVRLACERATRDDLHALAENIERTESMSVAARYLERVECSREFYRLLAAATHNQVLAMMVHAVTEILMQFVHARVATGGKPQSRPVEKRRAFLSALRARDADEATRLMRASDLGASTPRRCRGSADRHRGLRLLHSASAGPGRFDVPSCESRRRDLRGPDPGGSRRCE